jgi:hypothetical protein
MGQLLVSRKLRCCSDCVSSIAFYVGVWNWGSVCFERFGRESEYCFVGGYLYFCGEYSCLNTCRIYFGEMEEGA